MSDESKVEKPVELPSENIIPKQQMENVIDAAIKTPLPILPPPIEVTEEEKSLFMKGVLTDSPILFKMKGLGDALTVEFKTRTQDETAKIFEQLKVDIKEKIFDTELSYARTLRLYTLAVQCVSISGEKRPDWAEIGLKTAVKFFTDLKNENVLVIYTAMLEEFEKKIAHLNSQLLNGSFWKPASIS